MAVIIIIGITTRALIIILTATGIITDRDGVGQELLMRLRHRAGGGYQLN